jgi:hypothetical protein
MSHLKFIAFNAINAVQDGTLTLPDNVHINKALTIPLSINLALFHFYLGRSSSG